jgi:beta-phosphoglucomutase family hydrolase
MKLDIPNRKFGAYLFDCDGTIADTMPVHHRAWNTALKPFGASFDLELFYALAGMSLEDTVRILNEKHGLSMPFQKVGELKEEAYFKFLPEIKPVAAVLEQILLWHGKIPLAVVSGSPRDSVIKTLTALGLLDRFETIVGAEDYTRGKPDPEPFLTAARRVGVVPADCLVFEDAGLGIQAAKAAGMAWVRVDTRE